MPVVAAVAAVAAAGMQMYASSTQAKQEASNLKFQAAQGEADARTAQGAAIVEANRIREAAKQQRASAVAAASASGVDISSPTSVKIDEKIVASSEEDALLTILGGTDRSARINQQSLVDRQAAKNVMSNSKLANVGTALSTVSKLASNWSSMGGSGMGG